MKYIALALSANWAVSAEWSLYNVTPESCTKDASKTISCLTSAAKDGTTAYADMVDSKNYTNIMDDESCKQAGETTVFIGRAGYVDLGEGFIAIPHGIVFTNPTDNCAPTIFADNGKALTCPQDDDLSKFQTVEYNSTAVKLDDHVEMYKLSAIEYLNSTTYDATDSAVNVYVRIRQDCVDPDQFMMNYAVAMDYPANANPDQSTTPGPSTTSGTGTTSSGDGAITSGDGSTTSGDNSTGTGSTSSQAATAVAATVLSACILVFTL